MGLAVREKKRRTGHHGLIAALDVGSSKVTCFIAHAGRESESRALRLRIIGIGHQRSRGIRSSVIVDMEEAEDAIRAAVEAAERMADVTVEEVLLAVATGAPESQRASIELSVAGHEVDEGDLRRIDQLGRAKVPNGVRMLLHAIPLSYSLDGSPGIRDPRGMCGEKLGVTMHFVTAATAAMRNLHVCVERCHLRVTDHVLAPYASGLAALVEDETDLGATCIDMGGGTTSFGVFRHGELIACDVVPIGGDHVTTDIARGLVTTRAHAERLKTLYGSALAGSADERELISVPQLGEEEAGEPYRVPRSMLTSIIRPRLEEILEMVRERLERTGCEKLAGRRVVLTGGASQMSGLRELAQRLLERQVRLSAPPPILGLAPATAGPAFATATGLLLYAQRKPHEDMRLSGDGELRGLFSFTRLGRWLGENF
jgi:cell division protein FtsA